MLKKIKTSLAGLALAASMAFIAPVAQASDVIIIIICNAAGVCEVIIIV